MDQLTHILNIPIAQALGVIMLIGVAERVGIPIISIIKSIMKINGTDNYQAQIDELGRHADTSNHEVGLIQKDIVVIREDIAFIRGVISKN